MFVLETRTPELTPEDYMEMEPGQIDTLTGNTLCLSLGEISCALECPDRQLYEKLKNVFFEYETAKTPDISISMERTDRLSIEKLESAVFRTTYFPVSRNGFKTSTRILSGRYDSDRSIIKIKGESHLLDPKLKINHINKLLSLAYYTACKKKYDNNPPEMLVHSCSVLRNGRAILFIGPSGIGKTTVARLCGRQDGEVINDEVALVSRPGLFDAGVTVRSVPMIGAFPPQQKVLAPLHCIFLLKQSNQFYARKLDLTEAYLKFMRQVITPACIGYNNKRAVFTLLADFSAQVTGQVPVFELEFGLDGESLWRTVDNAEKSVKKRSTANG